MTYAALKKLKTNSVSTTISGDITDSAATIPVTELSCFYDADGVLILKGIVLGFDDPVEAYTEEITITGASGTSGAGNLTGATRGVKSDGSIGVGHAWGSGTKIATMVSTGIYDQICDNIAAHEANKAETTRPLDQMGIAGTTNTDRDTNTTNHGLAPKAVAPVSGLLNILGIAYGDVAAAWRALFDDSNPVMNGTAAPGTAVVAARRDHIHPSDTGRLANSGAANGKIYIGKADGTFALATLTQGANVIITNTDGAVTIASTGGGDFLVQQIFS